MSDDDSRKLTEDTVPGEPRTSQAPTRVTRSVTVVHPFTGDSSQVSRQRKDGPRAAETPRLLVQRCYGWDQRSVRTESRRIKAPLHQ